MDLQLSRLKDRAFVGGAWVEATSGGRFDVENPADGAVVAQVPDMDASDAVRAIDAAHAAFPGWSGMNAAARERILLRWSDLIMEEADQLAHIMVLEQGKPLAEARGEVEAAAGTVRWCAEQGRRAYGEFIDGSKDGTRILVSRHPVGVVGAVTPWNFPAGMITRKIGPALAAGCTAVLKPAEATPLSALALAALAEEAGLPAGVFNIVTSTRASDIGKVLTADSRVRKISFTGSTAVGRKLMAQASEHLQRVSLELGGNAPFVVFPSADLEKAAGGAMASKFRNAGQTCICANRIYVHRDVYDHFLQLFLQKIKALKVGDGRDKDVTIGPLIDEKAVRKVEDMIKEAAGRGARIHTGGKRHALGRSFFEPTLMTNVDESLPIACEEIFGPVAVLYPFDDEADVIRRANATPYGLAAYLYTQDLSQAFRVSDALESGMVGINEPLLASDLAPFGGVKESGFGREGGQYGILEYTEQKYRLIGV